MTRDLEDAFKLPSFRSRLWQASRTMTTRWLFWALLLFVASQQLVLLTVRNNEPQLPGLVASEKTSGLAGEDSWRSFSLSSGEQFPEKMRSLSLGTDRKPEELNSVDLSHVTQLYLNTEAAPSVPASLRPHRKNYALTVEVPESVRLHPTLTELHLRGLFRTPDLRGMGELRELGMEGMMFSDVPDGENPLEQLSVHKNLRRLSLSYSEIRPEWLLALKKLPKLGWLRLQGSPLGDEVIPYLVELKQVKELRIQRSRITESGWERLKLLRPDFRFEPDKEIKPWMNQRHRHGRNSQHTLLTALCFPLFGVGMLLTMHLKTVLAAPRARMMPGFVAPHMVLSAAMVLLVMTPPILAAVSIFGFSPVGPLAIGLLVLVMFSWQTWQMSQVLTIPSLAIWFALMFGSGTDLIGGFLSRWFLTPETTSLGIGLLTGCGLWFAVLVMRMMTVHEERSDYALTIPADGIRAMTSRTASRETDKLVGRAIEKSRINAWLMDRWFDVLNGRVRSTGGSLRRFLQYKMVHGFGLYVAIPMITLAAVFGIRLIPGSVADGMSAMFAGAFLPQFVFSGLGAVWLQHSKWHASEILRPQTRGEFLTRFFGSVGFDVGYSAVWLFIAYMILYANGNAAFNRSPEATLWLLGTFTTGYFVLAVSVLLLALSYRSFWVYIVSLTALFALAIAVGAAFVGFKLDQAAFALPAFLGTQLVISCIVLRNA